MKKNFTLLCMAAALTLGVTGCSKDDASGGIDTPDVVEGQEATVVLNLSFPATYAADPNATTEESAVETVDLFVLDPVTGNIVTHKTFPKGDLTSSGTNAWKAVLTTTSGEKKILAAVNLTNAIRSEIMAKGLKGADENTVHTVAKGELGDKNNDFAMFSRAVNTQTIIADALANPGDNDMTIEVDRMVAKVSVNGASANLSTELAALGTINPASLEYTLGNVNRKVFAMQYKDAMSVVRDPNYLSAQYNQSGGFNDTDFIPFLDGITDYAATDGADFRYAPENVQDLALKGTNTFVSVKAVFVPKEYTDDAGNTKANTPVAGESFWMVSTTLGEVYFFDVETEADDFANAGDIKSDEYVDGVCYYNSYLSKVNGYNVLRNNYYQVTITTIHSIGSTKPDVDDKEKPIEGDFATIDVVVDIQPWEMKAEDHELGK